MEKLLLCANALTKQASICIYACKLRTQNPLMSKHNAVHLYIPTRCSNKNRCVIYGFGAAANNITFCFSARCARVVCSFELSSRMHDGFDPSGERASSDVWIAIIGAAAANYATPHSIRWNVWFVCDFSSYCRTQAAHSHRFGKMTHTLPPEMTIETRASLDAQHIILCLGRIHW